MVGARDSSPTLGPGATLLHSLTHVSHRCPCHSGPYPLPVWFMLLPLHRGLLQGTDHSSLDSATSRDLVSSGHAGCLAATLC